MTSVHTWNEQETITAGKQFAAQLRPGDVVACYGDLGSGKTRFIKGICEALRVREHVASPTFTLINVYTTDTVQIFHFDLYRIGSAAELFELGFEEYTTGEGIALIEWAEKADDLLPPERYEVRFQLGSSEQERELSISRIVELAA